MSKSKEQTSHEVIADEGQNGEVAEVAVEGAMEQGGQQGEPTYPRLVRVISRPARPKKSRAKLYSRYPYL